MQKLEYIFKVPFWSIDNCYLYNSNSKTSYLPRDLRNNYQQTGKQKKLTRSMNWSESSKISFHYSKSQTVLITNYFTKTKNTTLSVNNTNTRQNTDTWMNIIKSKWHQLPLVGLELVTILGCPPIRVPKFLLPPFRNDSYTYNQT